jgi:hypothetical protein
MMFPSLTSVRLPFSHSPSFSSLAHLSLHTLRLTHHTDVKSTSTGVGVLDLNKTAAHAFFTKVFACSDNINITTRSVNGHKNFTAWESKATFNYVKPMEEVAHEEVFAPAMADGRSMSMVGVSLLWWNNDGKIVKIHDYSKTVPN